MAKTLQLWSHDTEGMCWEGDEERESRKSLEPEKIEKKAVKYNREQKRAWKEDKRMISYIPRPEL